ncbi:MAG: hypothetical protein JWS10_1403 [Cypionkella sp.]|uniref:NYN domain-containing protein n=1 Tax=Cypionkella sp. TaxID=2811411 RepID=UPI00260B34F9|nr:hypothetical protein [Cypionkella sp.]MDB5658788.1 hypothetical protein [Cypionkella sp.]MDB5667013.1 hypothetical protein [Cypionkella sp.]
MIVPLLLCLISVVGLALAVALPGWQDFVMLTGPALLAGLWILSQARLRLGAADRTAFDRTMRTETGPPRRGLFARAKPNYVVVDGSNVMHWKDGVPQIEAVKAVISQLVHAGYAPGVVFDANAGYKLMGRYKHDYALGKLLGLPADRVMVVDKGTPADPVILASAKALGARIVSNDRFRDWADTHPEISQPGHVIAGGYRNGQVWLDLA